MILRKPKFWDHNKPNIYAYFLYPISLLIQFINIFKKKTKKKKLKIKTICIGNIYIGGTGKTSLSIEINEILNENNIKSCFIKKYYQNQIDEQKILKNRGKLFLSSKRLDAINQAEAEGYDIAILDDGLQDKSIHYDLTFVCFNNLNWIGNGMTIPSGPLRENINNLRNYKHVFLNGNLENVDKIKNQIERINSEIEIHIGKYVPVNLREFNKDDDYLVFSGIGNHQTFVSMIKENHFKILKDLEYPDHYQYTDNDINEILIKANQLNCKIITTEKDYLRINNLNTDKIKFIKSKLKILDEKKLIKLII